MILSDKLEPETSDAVHSEKEHQNCLEYFDNLSKKQVKALIQMSLTALFSSLSSILLIALVIRVIRVIFRIFRILN